LAGWLAERGQTERAIPVLTSVNWVDPFDQELHGILGNLLLDAQRPQEALREFEVALALKPHDIVTAHFHLARAHAQLERDGRIGRENRILQAALEYHGS